MAHHLTILLGLLGIKAGELHGNLKQTDRLLALKRFRDQEIDVLIATDVAARGLDIKADGPRGWTRRNGACRGEIGMIKFVINYTLPSRYTRYVHRVGRTARAGHCGRSISLAAEKEFNMLKEIKKCSRSAMFERVLNKDVVTKYIAKVDRLRPAVKRVMAEEHQQKQMAAMEQSIKAMERRLALPEGGEEGEGGKPERTWFQTDNEIKQKTKARALKGKAKAAVEKAKRKMLAQRIAEDPEEKRIKGQVGAGQRSAKRGSKPKRLTHEDEFEAPTQNSASFLLPIPLTQKPEQSDASSSKNGSVSGPSYQERRDAFEQKNPGRKFNPRKKKK
ncbi:putative ATP-dependent RNA helicase DDX27 [Chionoecetes opilio]|uniref:Putative ATP-dependent RNA helicase DDX27 n=1 Tax=Chionoecetes opilio TaxID=41210 RepID=A0A8J5CGT7_CHIOP|nr:putative ATP-dependent RNA helicase DDX27 [Chionoecetes opilio]